MVFMMKNLFLLGALAWVTTSYAKVVHESVSDAVSYKIEKPAHEHEAKRSLAGGKIKKKRAAAKTDTPQEEEATESSDSDSEVRFWKYSEE
jgi:hypothetical protein